MQCYCYFLESSESPESESEEEIKVVKKSRRKREQKKTKKRKVSMSKQCVFFDNYVCKKKVNVTQQFAFPGCGASCGGTRVELRRRRRTGSLFFRG